MGIQKMAFEFLSDDYLFLGIGRVGGACKDVAQKFEQVEQYDKREKLLNIIRESQGKHNGTIKKTLVFVETKKDCRFSCLIYVSVQGECHIDSRRSATAEREEALRSFKLGEPQALVATA